MKIERIVSLANVKVRLQFLAMERSLRATGCDLPLSVIPFDETRFPLPESARWLEDDALFAIVSETGAVPVSRKYLAFTLPNCAFFDSDIIHLRRPDQWLSPLSDETFVVADTEWSKGRWTFTTETREMYKSKTTLWLLNQFNSGFFAQALPTVRIENIRALLGDPQNWKLAHGKDPSAGEQPGANLLIHESGIEVCNLCLPPHRMESTMSCDYPRDFEPLLRGPNGPGFIHYAGHGRNLDAPIARLIFEHLTTGEAAEMRAAFQQCNKARQKAGRWPIWARIAKRIVPLIDPRFELQWRGRN